LQITFRHMDPSPALEARIRELAARFDKFSAHIMRCRVIVEPLAHHAHQGALYDFRVEITLPDNTPWGGKPVRKLQLPRDAALVTILRGARVIVPQADEPLEGGDELLFVAVTEVEEELRQLLLPAH